MKSIEASGKSVDEAIFSGLQTMGTSLDEVTIDIIQVETKGVFGIGARPAIVRLTEREVEVFNAAQAVAEWGKESLEAYPKKQKNPAPARTVSQETPEKREPREVRPLKESPALREQRPMREKRPPREPRQARETFVKTEEAVRADTARAEEVKKYPKEPREPREPREPKEQREPQNRRTSASTVNYSEETAKSNEGAQFLSKTLTLMGVEHTLAAAETEEGLKLRIGSDAMGILIGHRGETLDSLQYLTTLVANKGRKDGAYSRVALDIENYRDKREETLMRLARKLASKVKATGRKVVLEPMNPYERRVLHATLQSNPYVLTHSEGEEPNRRVVITPKQPQRSKNIAPGASEKGAAQAGTEADE